MVLLVEDNPTDVFVIQEVLQGCGLNLTLHVFSDGQEALSYLQAVWNKLSPCPALVLLDLNVPKISGIELLRHIRSGEQDRRMPVIVVTSSTADGDRTAIHGLGADGYFQKPNDLAAYAGLAQLVRSVLCP